MRLSTSSIYEAGTARMSDLQSSLVKTQQQISTGRRILTPADDPLAAAAALSLTQAQTLNEQYATNRGSAKDLLRQEEGVLQGLTNLVQDVKTLTIGAGNVSYDDNQRKSLATELRGRFDELLGMSNTRDGAGNYLFSGYQTTVQPFTQTVTGVQYNGDQGQRLMQVSASRNMALGDTGEAVFQGNSKTGNGTFVTAAPLTNTGSGVVSTGTVTNSTLLTGHDYNITFTTVAGAMTYDIFDNTAGAAVPPASVPYVSGQAIMFDGMQFDVTGSPLDGDQFTVKPSTNQSLFQTIDDLITALNTPASGDVGQAKLNNALTTANNNFGHALDNVLTIRASVGSRLKELDTLDSTGEDQALQYAETLDDLQGLDYPKAITQLTQQQAILQAAQQSFLKITGLSLFNYLN